MRLLLVALALTLAGCEKAAPQPGQTTSMFDVGPMRVQDQADILSGAQEIELTRLSEQLERDTTDQLVVVTLKSLNGRDIAQLGTELGNHWGIGRADIDNGVLLIVAPNERKVRIATGRGMEGLLTDAKAAAIIKDMLPHFQGSDYFAGIRTGALTIETVLRSDTRRPQYLPATMRKAA